MYLSCRYIINAVALFAIFVGEQVPTICAPMAVADLPANPTVEQLIDEVEHRDCAFFWNESDPKTGLTKDRCSDFGPDTHNYASIASTGYALAALPIDVERGWISKSDAYRRAQMTLHFIANDLPNVHGWCYHFLNIRTGQRNGTCELSSIDTALMVSGALAAGQFFHGTEVEQLANLIYDRVDFPWMQNEGGTAPAQEFIAMDWKPETGWSRSLWRDFNEGPLLYFLAMGSPTHPITSDAWRDLDFNPSRVEGYHVFRGPGPLFIWQMDADYIDYRGLRDRHGYDFWVNSVNAHLASHAYCVRNPEHYKAYCDTIWGITACDHPGRYAASDDAEGRNDGTVAPSAAIASILFVPGIGRRSLAALYARYQDRLWGKYGFSDAFNADKDWYDKDILGIDAGMTMIALENYRSGLVWALTSAIPGFKQGLAAAGFHPTSESNPRPLIIR